MEEEIHKSILLYTIFHSQLGVSFPLLGVVANQQETKRMER